MAVTLSNTEQYINILVTVLMVLISMKKDCNNVIYSPSKVLYNYRFPLAYMYDFQFSTIVCAGIDIIIFFLLNMSFEGKQIIDV
jgi:hypothetical protein